MTQIDLTRRAEHRDTQTYSIIGAAMEVHRHLESGFLEPVYQAALEREFIERSIAHDREVMLPVKYKGHRLDVGYRADFVCFGDVLVELKSLDRLRDRDHSQIINYLSASGLGRGILLNFGASSLQYQRFAGPTSSGLSSVQSVKSVGPVS
jgi:GxxExxY protein